jgi:Cytochrome c biogenesis protein
MDYSANLSVIAAFSAGVLTFVSPCVLPLIPAYISFITGSSVDDLKNSKTSFLQPLLKSLVFVAGFSVIFIILGLSASWLGNVLLEYRDLLRYAGGTAVIIFGAHMTGIFRIGFLYRQLSANGKIKSGATWFGTFFVGCAFALGWTPCVGPILASILLLASTQDGVINGFFLLLFYSLGLGIPFILTALFINRFFKVFASAKKYYKAIEITAGALLMAIGVLIITNGFTKITEFLMKTFQ